MTLKSPQAQAWYPALESDCGNLQGVIGYLPLTTTVASGEVIQMVKVPLGATVIDCILETGALGTSVTCAVGDDDDTNRYITATDHSAAALTRRKQTDKVGVPYTYATEHTIDVLIAGANCDDNIAIRLDVFYVCGLDTTP
jgi:hypothetical protein